MKRIVQCGLMVLVLVGLVGCRTIVVQPPPAPVDTKYEFKESGARTVSTHPTADGGHEETVTYEKNGQGFGPAPESEFKSCYQPPSKTAEKYQPPVPQVVTQVVTRVVQVERPVYTAPVYQPQVVYLADPAVYSWPPPQRFSFFGGYVNPYGTTRGFGYENHRDHKRVYQPRSRAVYQNGSPVQITPAPSARAVRNLLP